MNMTLNGTKDQPGFALIAVLFSLVILVLLFGSAQKNFISHATFLGAQTHKENAEIVRQNIEAISQLYMANLAPISVELNGQSITPEFIDVGGLVDLNSATPDLLTKLLLGLKLSPVQASEAVAALRTFRRTGARLNRVSDFHRITGLTATTLPDLITFATVHSGRRGVAPNESPLALLEVLTGMTGPRDFLEANIKPVFTSPPSNMMFQVIVETDQMAQNRYAAVVDTSEQNRVRVVQYQR